MAQNRRPACAGPVLVVTVLALAAWAGVNASCPTSNSDVHLNSNAYTITASDLAVATTADATPANVSDGRIVLSEFTFASPERTNERLALHANGYSNIKATVYCLNVANYGCKGASSAGTDGNSTCVGCAGTVAVAVAGLGAWEPSGDHALCACTSSGGAITPRTIYHAAAANPHYFTYHAVSANTSYNTYQAAAANANYNTYQAAAANADYSTYQAAAANASYFTPANSPSTTATEHQTACDAGCACDTAGTATGPANCTCSCQQNMCNTMNTVNGTHGGLHSTNCSCSASGASTGQPECGCSCVESKHMCNTMNTVNGTHGGLHSTNCSCSASGASTGQPECGCSCVPTAYTCTCARKTCRSETSPDGKTFMSRGGVSTSGGGTCQVTAACSSGFYDGGVYTAYSTLTNVQVELFGPDGALPSTYLQYATAIDVTSGVFWFKYVRVVNYAEAFNKMYIKIHAGADSSKKLSTPASASFAVWPTKFKVVQTAQTSRQYLTSQEYKVDAGVADIGNYNLYLLDSSDQIISGVSSASGFNATVSLITGPNSDSSLEPNYGSGSYTELTNLSVFSRVTNAELSNRVVVVEAENNFMTFGMHVRKNVGQYFGIVVAMEYVSYNTKYSVMCNQADCNSSPGSSNSQKNFRIVAGNIQVAHGAEKTVFAHNTAPNIVKVDGANTNATMNVDGLPNPLHVLFQDEAGTTLELGTCTDCVQVRLVQCTDATGKASSPSTTTTAYPTCSAVAQAECAASSGTGASAKCLGSTDYLDTLTGTTLVNMVAGVATFPDLQISHVVGAGYKLQFTHNALDKTSKILSVPSNTFADTQVDFPTLANNLNNSFFVRPYALGIGRDESTPPYGDIGDEGVDNNNDGRQDGVPNGFTFKRQPSIYLKGKGYDFTTASNVHGWTPITAEIKTCGGRSCATKDLRLSGTTTSPSWNFKKFDANTGIASEEVTQQASVHMKYNGNFGKIAMEWSDLQIDTNDTAIWQNDVVLTYKVGPGPVTGLLPATYTSIDSNSFDVYTFPDPPRNLRVHSYGDLGFRVEFDPAPVSRAQPLTGFIIEVDVCEQDATRCTKRGTSTSNACAADTALNKSDACFSVEEGLGRTKPAFFNSMKTGFDIGLGSDLTSGGGYTEDVMLNYTGATAGGDSAVNFYINPSRTLYAGDQLFLNFGTQYKFQALNEFTTCTFTGPDADSIEVAAFDKHASTLTLKVAARKVLLATKPVVFSAPETCKIKLPPKGSTTHGFPEDHPPPTIIHAPVLGSSTSSRGDNCKGVTPGCVAKSTYILQPIQDSSTKDADWTGQMYSGGGQYQSSLNDGAAFTTSDDDCRSGRPGISKLCALSIGQDWSMGVDVAFNWNPSKAEDTVGLITSSPLMSVNFTRDRALAIGDWIDIPVPGMSMLQGSQTCAYFVEKGATAGPASFGLANFSNANPWCAVFFTEVNMIADATLGGGLLKGWGWETYFNPATSMVSIHVGSTVMANTMINVKIHGFSAATSSLNLESPGPIDASVRRGKRTTVIFENGADSVDFSPASYQPGYPWNSKTVTSKGLTITAGEIYNFRVYAYNERFKSSAVNTLVQNRAIQKPAAPAYFTQVKQELLPAKLRFNNLVEGYINSNNENGRNPPAFPGFNAATRVGIKITPDRDIRENSILAITLPAFVSDIAYLPLSNIGGNKLLQDIYQVDGHITYSLNASNSTDHGCTCDADGAVETPRNKYRVTRIASGSDAVTFTSTGWADDVITNFPPPNISIPAKSCGECACSDAGLPFTPATIYNTTGNCTSCTCDASGVSSHVAPWQVWPQPGEPASVVTGICSNCTCSDAGVISTGNGNCSKCMCTPQVCNCACPLFRKCDCGCELYESYKCGCRQTMASEIFSTALWSTTDHVLLLTVNEQKMLKKGVPETLWISKETGIKTPLTVQEFAKGLRPYDSAALWGFAGEVRLQRFKLNWVSPFPNITAPRLGFVVQYTTDLFWGSDIQTVHYPDDLSEGIAFEQLITTLSAGVTATDASLPLTAGAPWIRRGQHVMLDLEIVKVKRSNATHLDVVRGVYSTAAVEHLSGIGVSLVRIGATDPSIEGGVDDKVGLVNDAACKKDNTHEFGCNPSQYVYPNLARIFSSGEIVAGETPQAKLVECMATVSGSTNSTYCSSGCVCSETAATRGADLGSPRPRGGATLVSPGDVRAYPKDFKGRLVLGVTASTTNMVLDSSTLHLNWGKVEGEIVYKYIRVDDEIMKVIRVGERGSGFPGIVGVGTFKVNGGSGCTCALDGTVSGVNSCSCSGHQGTGCDAPGTITAKEGTGRGFAATFTVAGGKIASITITDPGEDYTGTPALQLATGGAVNATYHPCQVTFYPIVSKFTITVVRAQLGTLAAAHTAASKVSTILWASQKVVGKPTKRYSFRIAAYNQAGMSDFVYYDLLMRQKNLNKLLPQGNEHLIISLIGGGLISDPSDFSATFVPPGTTDITKGQPCTSVTVHDNAGTKLSCKTPSLLGAKFDLIVNYASGMFSNTFSQRGFTIDSPSITGLESLMPEPDKPLVITVFGNNFGKKDSGEFVEGKIPSVTGRFLYGDDDSESLVCAPLEVVSNTRVKCTLGDDKWLRVSKEKKDIIGKLVMVAGSGTNTVTFEEGLKLKLKPVEPLKVQATIAADFTAITASPALVEEFKATFAAETASALGIAAHLLEILGIAQGSVIVIFNILPDTSSTTAVSPAALALNLAAQAANPNSALRQGSLTGAMTVVLPPGTAELAAESGEQNTSTASLPLYFTNCVPRSYSAWDMEICYDCCSYLCETGTEVPEMGGQTVLPGYRAQVCQSECMTHCGYARPLKQP